MRNMPASEAETNSDLLHTPGLFLTLKIALGVVLIGVVIGFVRSK